MGRSRSGAGAGEKAVGYSVLAVLAVFVAWLFTVQSQFNPAVIVAMNHPKGSERIMTGPANAQPVSETASRLADLQGFTALSPVESYDSESLSDKIDGKAELYLASGFQEMACRSFAPGEASGARVEVFLYAMDTPKDAFAVFSGQRRAGGDPLALTANAYATENAIFLARDRFYLELVSDQTGPEIRQGLTALGQSILATLPQEAAQGSDTALFPADGLRADSVQLAVSDALGMAGLENVYTAQYSLKSGEAAAFLAVRGSPQEAQAQAQAYAGFLQSMGFKESTPPDAPAGAEVLVQDDMMQVVMAKGRVFAGVHDSANALAALELAGNLAKSLEGKTP